MALNLTKVGSRLITLPKGKTLTSGGIVKRNTVLGNKSRILKIHPSQLIALGRGKVKMVLRLLFYIVSYLLDLVCVIYPD